MKKALTGNSKKNGCQIDNDARTIICYEFLNVVERLQGKEHSHCISYDEIFYIEVFSHLINEIRSGSINIFIYGMVKIIIFLAILMVQQEQT